MPLCLASVEVDTRSGEGERMNCEKRLSSHSDESMRVLSRDQVLLENFSRDRAHLRTRDNRCGLVAALIPWQPQQKGP
jgi:hypothetical protein